MRGYRVIDHELRSLLFGNGIDTRSGFVKGEDARLRVAALLNEMQTWAEIAHTQLEEARRVTTESGRRA